MNAFEAAFAEYIGVPYCCAVCSGTAAMHLALRHLLAQGAPRGARVDAGGAAAGGPEGAGAPALGQRRGGEDGHPRVPAGRELAAAPLVVASTLTFIGSVTPATFEGCDITFIDTAPDSWNMDPALLEEELAACAAHGRLPAAVIPTDLYGDCCDLPRIVAICDRFGVPVICDSAEAAGAFYKAPERPEGRETRSSPPAAAPGASADTCPRARPSAGWRHAGADAWAAVYSFNGNKILTTSGGGMLASHDKVLIDHARKLATQAREPLPHYEHTEIGYNYRMSNIVAAIGLAQLEVLEERVARKRAIRALYEELLGGMPGIGFMPVPWGQRPNAWLTVILIDEAEFGAAPEAVRLALEAENVEARPVWKPMHLQPVFQPDGAYGSRHEVRAVRGERSEALFRQGLCLPSGTAMSDDDVRRVAGIIAAQRKPGTLATKRHKN